MLPDLLRDISVITSGAAGNHGASSGTHQIAVFIINIINLEPLGPVNGAETRPELKIQKSELQLGGPVFYSWEGRFLRYHISGFRARGGGDIISMCQNVAFDILSHNR